MTDKVPQELHITPTTRMICRLSGTGEKQESLMVEVAHEIAAIREDIRIFLVAMNDSSFTELHGDKEIGREKFAMLGDDELEQLHELIRTKVPQFSAATE